MDRNQKPRKRRPTVVAVLQIALVIILLVTTMGASGIFAYVLCPGCSPMRMPEDFAPAPPVPTEADKEKKGPP